MSIQEEHLRRKERNAALAKELNVTMHRQGKNAVLRRSGSQIFEIPLEYSGGQWNYWAHWHFEGQLEALMKKRPVKEERVVIVEKGMRVNEFGDKEVED